MVVMIAGAGVAGLSAALALARRGLASTVIEQADAIEPVGAGIQLGPNATRVLFELGLEQAIVPVAVSPFRVDVRDAISERILVRTRLGDRAVARWGAPYLTLTRAALQTALLQAALATGLVEFKMGRPIVGVRSEGGRAEVELEGGEMVSAEVLLGCDGIRSRVREAIARPAAPRFTGQTAWRGLAKMPTPNDEPVRVWTGPHRHFVRYPVAPGVMNMVAVIEARPSDRESWIVEGDPGDLVKAFTEWPQAVRATIAAVERPWLSALYDRRSLARWTAGRVSLLGDAAHPMLPFLAQGAGMAIEDAFVVARLLAEAADPTAALATYEQARKARTSKVQAWATRNGRLFHLPPTFASGLFGTAYMIDRFRDVPPEARLDWLYGWTP